MEFMFIGLLPSLITQNLNTTSTTTTNNNKIICHAILY